MSVNSEIRSENYNTCERVLVRDGGGGDTSGATGGGAVTPGGGGGSGGAGVGGYKWSNIQV